jgi:hypothetical protein
MVTQTKTRSNAKGFPQMSPNINDDHNATRISGGKNPTKGKALAARRPLQPRECRLTAVRLQIKAGGYDIIPLRDKKGFEGWPKQPNDETAIRKWWGTATGIRMYRHDVFVLDIDVKIAAVVKAILDAYTERWPAFMQACLRRHSGAHTIALIGRCNTAKRWKRTWRFLAEPDDTDGKGHMVEFFGRNDKRLTAVHGRHSEGRVYDYHGDPIWTRPVDSLPWFPDEDIMTALALAETIMMQHGLLAKRETVKGRHGPGYTRLVYDLEPDDVIRLANDDEITLEELELHMKAGLMTTLVGYSERERMCVSMRLAAYANLWDPASTTRDRVLISIGSTGLCLWDTKNPDVSHRWKHRAPPPDELGDQIRALMANTTLPWRKTP